MLLILFENISACIVSVCGHKSFLPDILYQKLPYWVFVKHDRFLLYLFMRIILSCLLCFEEVDEKDEGAYAYMLQEQERQGLIRSYYESFQELDCHKQCETGDAVVQ